MRRATQERLRTDGAEQPVTLIVPGLNDSGPAHWQSDWERRHPDYRRVIQRDWGHPDLREWSWTLAAEIDASSSPVFLVAHSFGCLVAATVAAAGSDRIAGMLLVAPPDPARFEAQGRVPDGRLQAPSILVGSRNDPWLSWSSARALAERWGSRLVDLGHAGHINANAGYGPWPYGEELLETLRTSSAQGPNFEVHRSDPGIFQAGIR